MPTPHRGRRFRIFLAGLVVVLAGLSLLAPILLRGPAVSANTAGTHSPPVPPADFDLEDPPPGKPEEEPEKEPEGGPDPGEVTQLAGKIPASGEGRYDHAPPGPMLGTRGMTRPFRIAVERGTGEDVAGFAAAVNETLGDDRSWTRGGRLRLRQVGAGERADFTVHLVTRETARRLCAAVGLDIRMRGTPYTSCRAGSRVVINLDRWRLSVPDYVNAGISLREYRRYVINHEVGHALGHRHRPCPGRGEVAPVMQQQTKGLNGCTANPWPYP